MNRVMRDGKFYSIWALRPDEQKLRQRLNNPCDRLGGKPGSCPQPAEFAIESSFPTKKGTWRSLGRFVCREHAGMFCAKHGLNLPDAEESIEYDPVRETVGSIALVVLFVAGAILWAAVLGVKP